MGQGLDLLLRSPPGATIRVLVVDDHVVFSDALATILRTEPEIEVVGKGGTVQEAISSARALQPEVVLLDVHMPDGSGIEAAAAIKKDRPQTQIVILTSDEDEAVLRSAVQARDPADEARAGSAARAIAGPRQRGRCHGAADVAQHRAHPCAEHPVEAQSALQARRGLARHPRRLDTDSAGSRRLIFP